MRRRSPLQRLRLRLALRLRLWLRLRRSVPGSMLVTRTPVPYRSARMARERWLTNAFDAQYTLFIGSA